MIKVKGSKSKAAANPAEAYASKAPEKKGPATLYGITGMMFAPLILYLAKLFARDDEAAEEKADAEQDATGPFPGLPLIQTASYTSEHDEAADEPFDLQDVPDTITFLPSAPQVVLPVFNPAGFVPGQANDNAGPDLPVRLPDGGAVGAMPVAAVTPLVPKSPGSGGRSDAPSPGLRNEDEGDAPEGEESDDDAADDGDEEVKPANRAPVVSGPVYLPDVFGCALIVFGLSDLLRYAADPDGDALSIKDVSVTSGTVSLQNGAWTFLADGTGPVTVNYSVSDGQIAIAQTAHFNVYRPAPILGTADDDLLIGTHCGDEIDSGAGDDNIDGRSGDDVIHGGDGDDHIVAGAGNDIVWGGPGHDIIFGGTGDDHLFGGSGNDRIYGGSGNDIIFGGSGDDFVDAGDGDDVVHAGDGDDVVLGGAGNDVVSDGAGADQIYGGAGDDHVIAALDKADDIYDGGSGHDTLDYSDAEEAIRVDLVEGTAQGNEIGDDHVENFEVIVTGAGDDVIVFGDRAVMVVGGDGCNTFDFSEMSWPSDGLMTLTHKVSDFKVGDRIRESAERIYEDVFERIEDEFERVFDTKIDFDRIPIRYSHDRFEEITRGRVEVDVQGNGEYELVIMLGDQHSKLLLETA